VKMNFAKRKYIGKSYQELFRDLVEYLRSRGFELYSSQDVVTILLETMVYIVDNLIFYLDLQFNELFLDTAVTEEAVVRLASQMGYIRRGAEPSKVKWLGSGFMPETYTVSAYTFNRWFQTDTLFEGQILTQTLTSPPQRLQKVVLPVPEGFQPAHNYLFFECDDPNTGGSQYYFPFDGIVNNQVESRRKFLVRYLSNAIIVYFGDGNYLSVPPTSGTFRYLVTHGHLPLLAGFRDDNVNVIDLGSNMEDIESVRTLAPHLYWFGNRFITYEDILYGIIRYNPNYVASLFTPQSSVVSSSYGTTSFPFFKYYVENVGNLLRQLAASNLASDVTFKSLYSEWSKLESLLMNFGAGYALPIVVVNVLKKTGVGYEIEALSSAEIDDLKNNWLFPRMPVATYIEVISDISRVVPVKIHISVQLTRGYSWNNVRPKLESVLTDWVRSFNFGTPVKVGYLYEIVNVVPGIDNAVISFSFGGNPDWVNKIKVHFDSKGTPFVYEPNEGMIFGVKAIFSEFPDESGNIVFEVKP
jgi:hypothetical protein